MSFVPARARTIMALHAACLAILALTLAGCFLGDRLGGSALEVSGVVIMPDSTVLFGAEISTFPPTSYVSTDEDGRFWMTMPRADTYTFVATHPEARFRDMEGRMTEVTVGRHPAPHLVIMIGRSQRMPLMDVGERAPPALRRGKKRTG